MCRFYRLCIASCLLSALSSAAFAQGKHSEARGELLYKAHCNTCHTEQIHWREQKLARDWEGLVAQVRRWQRIGGLNWNESEIADVAHYLNVQFYEYKSTAQIPKSIRFIQKENGRTF